MRQQGFRLKLKRAFDVTVAGSLLIAGAPLLASLLLITKAKIGSPALFRQRRPGRHGQPFELFKLRTMTNERDAQGGLLPDAKRLTPLGLKLRELSLDELPQLWNVVRGDMSLVGPRPLLMQYLERYTPEQARRHEVLPGITGLCQVSGRNALTWEEKFALDVQYVDEWSLLLDAKILFSTVRTVFASSGISHGDYATMPEFLGYDGKAVAAPEYRTPATVTESTP
jgi:sugar transferase EpsL